MLYADDKFLFDKSCKIIQNKNHFVLFFLWLLRSLEA